jgi:hypothetical protein
VLDFANKIIELTGSKSTILFKPLPWMIPRFANLIFQSSRNSRLGAKSKA